MRRHLGTMIVLALCSCGGVGNKQALDEALYEYSHGIRWGQTQYVARYLTPRAGRAYAMKREALGDLRVTGCAVRSVKLQGKEKALVTLRVVWFRLHHGRLRSTLLFQEWSRKGDRWHVVEQRMLKGSPLPLFMKPARAI